MSDDLNAKMILGLRRFAKSVMVISCEFEGHKYAMSATAVSEVSLDPPSMLVCINHNAKIFSAMQNGAPFCINMLQTGHKDVAQACGGAKQGEDRFSIGDWREQDDIPYLHGAQANFFCSNAQAQTFGTHDIFIGVVTKVLVEDSVDPLVYIDGLYLPIQL